MDLIIGVVLGVLAIGILWVISYFNHKINDLDCKITELRLRLDRQPIPKRTTYASYSDLKKREDERKRYEKQWKEAHEEFDSWDLDLENDENYPEIDKLKE